MDGIGCRDVCCNIPRYCFVSIAFVCFSRLFLPFYKIKTKDPRG